MSSKHSPTRREGQNAPAVRSAFSLTRANFVRIGLVGVMLAALFLSLLLNIQQNNKQTAGNLAAAPVTPEANLDFSQINGTLPENKTEAEKIAKKYPSNFNFDMVKTLNRNVGAIPPWANQTNQVSLPNNATPTPTPTQAFTPTPGGLGIFAATAPVDSFEVPLRDDTLQNAKSITVASTQSRTFDTPSDVDWIIFVLNTGGGIPHSIIITSSILTGTDLVDPAVELYNSNLQLIAANDTNAITGPPSPPGARIDWTPLNSSQPVTYYLKVFSAIATGGTGAGSYTVVIERGRADAVPASTFTPIVSPTASPTIATTPTQTPTPSTCRDIYEDDNDPTRARFIKPSFTTTDPFNGTPGVPVTGTANVGAQNHFICPRGDVDWVYMDLVKGKAYSIFTTNLTNGIDTYMALYQVQADGKVAPIFANDDYPGMGLASRIDWVVPETPGTPLGEFVRYYLAVKDVANQGENLLSYTLILASPGDALGQCFDAYETDGKAQDAKEILLNETQVHTFCGQNDTDWVKFFAKKDRGYTIQTVFPTPNAIGLDTKMSLWVVKFESEVVTPGSTIIQQTLVRENDDRSDTDLSSSISFSVPEEGYYYVQISNAGGIGRNDLYYRINFGIGSGSPVSTLPAPTGTATPTRTPGATISPAQATQTASIANTLTALAATQTALASVTSGTNTNTIANPSGLNFADTAFQKVWDYADLPVIQNKVPRTWLWGKPGPTKLEIYAEAFDGLRQVQYFDKSRMEINNTKADRNSKWFVSNGLLVKELITGKIATGNAQWADLPAAELPVAGDLASNNPAPKYSAFAGLITLNDTNQVTNKVGQIVNEQIAGDGKVSTLSKLPQTVKYSNFVKETGHNIPDVFWQYLINKGMVFDGKNFVQADVMDWVYVMGLPLTEAYWTKAIVGGVERDVMVQIFERRVLTFTPANPTNWQVEMGNVGQHYYLWRYSN
jgi:hypothetical protein